MSEVNGDKRRYDNRGRQSQAAARRAAILRAGHDQLVAHGYSATTMTAIAKAAEVSVETVYKTFGTKSELVGQILGTAVVGDDEPVALIDRPAIKAALDSGDGAAILDAFIDVSIDILSRVGSLLAVLLIAGRNGEPELRAISQMANEQRLADIRTVVGAISAAGDLDSSLDNGRAADSMWAIGSPEVFQQLTTDRGWTIEQYRNWLTSTLRATLLRS